MFELEAPRKGERTKDRVLEAAISLFAKNGYEGTSFSQIATLLKLSQSAVMHHYPTKEALLMGVVEKILAHNHLLVSSRIFTGDNGLQKLSVYFRESLRWAITHRDESQIILLLYYMSCYNKAFAKVYKQILTAVRQRIYNYLVEARDGGHISPDRDLESVTYLLHDALLGGIVNFITTQKLPIKQAMGIHTQRWQRLFEDLLGAKAAKILQSCEA